MNQQTLVLVVISGVLSLAVGIGIPVALAGHVPNSQVQAQTQPDVSSTLPSEPDGHATIAAAPKVPTATSTIDRASSTATRAVLPTETPSPTVVDTPTAFLTATATVTDSPTAALPVPASQTSTPPPPGSPSVGHVANTGGTGVYIRHHPSLSPSERWGVWLDGSAVVILGPSATADGVLWLQVHDPLGRVGWMAARYIAR